MKVLLLIISCAALGFALPSISSESLRYLPDQSGVPQGGIILRYPDVSGSLANQLGSGLSEYGWSVLLVPSVDTASPSLETIDLNQLVTYMTTEKGQLNLVVLSIGDTWDADINLTTPNSRKAPQNPVRGLVLIDVPGDVPAPPELPVLDIVTHGPTVHGFKQRRKTARRDRLNQQQGLIFTYSTRATLHKENLLGRRIRGWLHHHVKGMEISETGL
ncbi:MAG: hypothetical protein ACJAYE_001057 [Candidatus Azotimanducaceae bacterium]|jgi:hypothetical protein